MIFWKMSSLKFLSNYRYIASPFTNVQDLSWRLLMRKFGVHLCLTNAVKALDVIQDAENTRDNLLGFSALSQEDRPLIVQVQD